MLLCSTASICWFFQEESAKTRPKSARKFVLALAFPVSTWTIIETRATAAVISTDASRVTVRIIPTDEEQVMGRLVANSTRTKHAYS